MLRIRDHTWSIARESEILTAFTENAASQVTRVLSAGAFEGNKQTANERITKHHAHSPELF